MELVARQRRPFTGKASKRRPIAASQHSLDRRLTHQRLDERRETHPRSILPRLLHRGASKAAASAISDCFSTLPSPPGTGLASHWTLFVSSTWNPFPRHDRATRIRRACPTFEAK